MGALFFGLGDPQVLGSLLAAFAAAATVYTLAIPMLDKSGLQTRMKAVGAERERIRTRVARRLALATTPLTP